MLTIQEQLSKLYYTWVNEIKGRFNQGLRNSLWTTRNSRWSTWTMLLIADLNAWFRFGSNGYCTNTWTKLDVVKKCCTKVMLYLYLACSEKICGKEAVHTDLHRQTIN